MNPLVKVGLGVAATATSGAIGYGVYSNLKSTEKVGEKANYSKLFEGALLTTTGQDHKTQWGARLATLKKLTDDTTLVTALGPLRTKDGENVWEELRDWCKDIINNESKEESDKEYKNVQNYCTFSIKEKIGKVIEGDGDANNVEKWGPGHKKLKTMKDNEMDSTLKSARDNSDETASKKALKAWCVDKYDKPFKNEKEQKFVNAKILCLDSVG